MYDLKRLGNNIRCLRKANGETQEELGAVLFLEKSTISSYENGSREPSKDKLILIANHFMVTVEDLLNYDFSDYEKKKVNLSIYRKRIDSFFPILTSEKAMENKHFKKAYKIHSKIYDIIRDGKDEDIDVDECLNEYIAILDSDIIIYEAAANYISLCYFFITELKNTPKNIKNRTAVVLNAAKNDKEIKSLIDDPSQMDEKKMKEALKEFNNTDVKKRIKKAIILLKKSESFSDLADYYLALQYANNIIDNDSTDNINARIGVEMLKTFHSIGNKYADDYFEYSYEVMGW